MQRSCQTFVATLVLSCLFAPIVTATSEDDGILVSSYLHLSLLDQVTTHAEKMCRGLPTGSSKQVVDAAGAWTYEQKSSIRDQLIAGYGATAQKDFHAFVSEFTTAEANNDADYLHALAQRLEWAGDGPASFAELRAGISASHLREPVNDAANLLGNIQTWVDLTRKSKTVPPLQAWLARDEATPLPSQISVVEEEDPLAALMGQEATFDAPPEAMEAIPNQLDSYQGMREERSQRLTAEAQQGMQLVAQERQAAEESYAAKKLADAEAEVGRVKRHAQALADVEKEALKQAENSWGNRLKRVAGATVSSAGGAFLGGIGSEAGKRAADELFE